MNTATGFYLTPMVLGGIATVLAAGWKFLGIGNPQRAKALWTPSMPWGAGSGRSILRAEFQILKKKLTTFSKNSAPNPLRRRERGG